MAEEKGLGAKGRGMAAKGGVNGVQVLQGDCLEGMATLPAGSVHCCVTSPPYWGLRQYTVANMVCLRYDLTPEERRYVLQELEKHGIKPQQ